MFRTRNFIFLACALPVALLTSCNTGGEVSLSTSITNEIQMSPPEQLQDKTQKLLGIHEWRSNVILPANSNMAHYSLELHERGKKPRSIAGVGVGKDAKELKRELRIALDPSNSNWFQAKELKIAIHTNGSGGTSEIDNPFKNATSMQAHTTPIKLPDGGFILLTANRNNRYFKEGDSAEGAQHDLTLVLKAWAK